MAAVFVYGGMGQKLHRKKTADKAVCGFLCVPGGARFSRVQVPNPPGSGKDIAEGKGVHREVESEGSRIWGTY